MPGPRFTTAAKEDSRALRAARRFARAFQARGPDVSRRPGPEQPGLHAGTAGSLSDVLNGVPAARVIGAARRRAKAASDLVRGAAALPTPREVTP